MTIIIDYSRLVRQRELSVANRQLSQVTKSRREHEEKAAWHIEQATKLERDEAALTAQVKRLEETLYGEDQGDSDA